MLFWACSITHLTQMHIMTELVWNESWGKNIFFFLKDKLKQTKFQELRFFKRKIARKECSNYQVSRSFCCQ